MTSFNKREYFDDFNGRPVVDYYIFKVFPFIEGMAKPNVKGDPEKNHGIPSGDFVTYKNIEDEEEFITAVEEAGKLHSSVDVKIPDEIKTTSTKIEEEPVFETPTFQGVTSR